MLHYQFIKSTDKKSLFQQIQFLVNCGKRSYFQDVNSRRCKLQELLETEEKIYENEFTENIKSRVDLNIRQRKEDLMAMKRERMRENEIFVATKKVHQNILNCLDIRDELRRKDYELTQRCQIQQMMDNCKAKEREKKEEEFWINVQKRVNERTDEQQAEENMILKCLQVNQCKGLKQQLEERKRIADMDIAYNRKVRHELEANYKADVEKYQINKLEKQKEAREARQTVQEQQKYLQDEAERFTCVFHRETMKQVNEEIEEELQKNMKLKEETLDYLRYVRKFRNFLNEQENIRDTLDREANQNFYCFKRQQRRNIMDGKKISVGHYHDILLKQICEDQAKKMREALADREVKEINFPRLETRDKVRERLQFRKDLDAQIREMNRLREEKQKQFEDELTRAAQDKVYCDKLLEKHKTLGCDYLTPHPNWTLVNCCDEKPIKDVAERDPCL